VRIALVALTLGSLACVGRARPDNTGLPATHVKLHFEPPTEVALRYSAVDGPMDTVVMDSIVEAAGRVESTRGDTLTIVAFYVTRMPVTGADARRTVLRDPSRVARLTVVVGPMVRVEPWTASSERSNRIFRNTMLVVMIAVLLPLVIALAHGPI